MREPANESLFTDVSRLRSYRCTIIVPTTSRAFVEREGCCASELDKGHKRVGKGAPAQTEPQSQSSRAPCPRVRPVFTLATDAWARRAHNRRRLRVAPSLRVFAHPTGLCRSMHEVRSVATVGLVREESAQQEQDDRTSYEQSAA